MKLPTWLRTALLVSLGLAAYSNTAHVPFLFDDLEALVNNASIRSISPRMLAPPHDITLAGRPFSNLTFALNYAISELRLAPLHWTNLALHLVAGLLLMALVRRTLLLPRFAARYADSADGIALAAALVWTLHPVQTESVTYLVQRVETLAGLFLILMLYALPRSHQAKRPFAWGATAVLACGLGMASKETMVVAPALAVLYDATFLSDSLAEALRKRGPLHAGLACTWLVLALQLVTNPRGMSLGLYPGGFLPQQYLGLQAGAIAHYLRLLLVPVGLTFDYGEAGCAVPLAHFAEWAPPALLVLALLGLGVWGLVRRSPAGFLALAFFVLLAPSSSVIPIATEVISEHRLYLPSAAALSLAVVAVHRMVGPRRALGAALAVVAVLSLAVLTLRRNRDYRSTVAIWQDSVRNEPRNSRGWWALGNAFRDEGNEARAREAHEKSLRVASETCEAALQRDPSFVLALWQAAILDDKRFELTGESAALDRSIGYYQRYLELRKGDANMQLNLAHALEKRGRIAEALERYRQAMALEPGDFAIAGDAANCLARAGRFEEAAAAYRSALALKPDWAVGHYNYAAFLARTGGYDAALGEFDKALALDRKLVVAWHRRGLVASWAGRPGEAVKDLEAALRLEPGRIEAMQDLAWLLATHPDASVRNGARALALAEKTRSETVRLLDVLAAAQAEMGHTDLAQRTLLQALGLASKRGTPDEALQARLEAYQAGRPWRETPTPKR
jgi:tetratricopeptide (TPR) repeat protein